MKKSSKFFKKFSQFCGTMSEVEVGLDDLGSDIEKLESAAEAPEEIGFQKKLAVRFNKLAKSFAEIEDTLAEAEIESDDAMDEVPAEFSKKFARMKRMFSELQECLDSLLGEVSKASAVAASSAEVPDEKESVNSEDAKEEMEEASIEFNFSKSVKSVSSRIGKLFKKFSEKLEDVAEEAEELVDEINKDEEVKVESVNDATETPEVKESVNKNFMYAGLLNRRKKFAESDESIMNEKAKNIPLAGNDENDPELELKHGEFEECPECGHEPCECDNKESKLSELAEQVNVATEELSDLIKKEDVPEETKEAVVKAFTEMAECLDECVSGEGDQEELAEKFVETEEVIKEFCDSMKNFSSRRRARKVVKMFSEMPTLIESIVEAPTEETKNTPKVESEVIEKKDGEIEVKTAEEVADKVIDMVDGCEEIIKDLKSKNFAKSLLRRARRVVCFSEDDLDKKFALLKKYFEEVKEELDRDEVKPEESEDVKVDEVSADQVEVKEDAAEGEPAEEVPAEAEKKNFTEKESEEATSEEDKEVEESSEESDDESEEVIKEFSEEKDEVDEVIAEEAPVEEVVAEEVPVDEVAEESEASSEDDDLIQFGEDITEETLEPIGSDEGVQFDEVDEVIAENQDDFYEDAPVDSEESEDAEEITDKKIVQFSKSQKVSGSRAYDAWITRIMG